MILLLKCNLFNFDMLITFCFGVSSNLSQQKSPTVEILCIYFLRKIVLRKYMRKISAVGLFCCDKFEETPKQKVINMSKLNKFHFNDPGGPRFESHLFYRPAQPILDFRSTYYVVLQKSKMG